MRDLVERLVEGGALRTPRIIEAFRAVDRGDFVRQGDRPLAYEDAPLPIGFDQTISQPTTVAIMLELLAPHEGEKILDVGSGSAWTTALLARIVGPSGIVRGVEKIPELASFGKENLSRCGVPWTSISLAGETLGLPAEGPFDKILVSAAANALPETLLDQLKIGGTLVLPIRTTLSKITKGGERNYTIETFEGFAFVPLVE